MLFLPIVGVYADKLGRAKVIAIADVILSFFIMLIAVLFITGNATIALLAIIGVIVGSLNAFWYPAMSALTPEVVPDQHLQPANGFVAMAQNGGLIAGSALGGFMVATVGSGVAIAIDPLTFLVAGLLVYSFQHVSTPGESKESMLNDLAHGWQVFSSYKWIVVIVAAFSLIVVAFAAFLLGIALDVFHVVWITSLQRKVPREALSRVSSYDAMGSLMFGPIGLALAGPLISGAGATVAFGIAGVIALAAIIGSLLFTSVRAVINKIEMAGLSEPVA